LPEFLHLALLLALTPKLIDLLALSYRGLLSQPHFLLVFLEAWVPRLLHINVAGSHDEGFWRDSR
jgi:hypothetical protein